MATYPSAIYSPRTKANASGVVYDADDADRIFAEDVSKDDAEIVAIQTELGTLPKGSSASVKARLENIEATRDGFSDRGDPEEDDFTGSDFTKDSDWHELDLSSIVPSGVKLVLLRVFVVNSAAQKVCMFKKNGNYEDYNVAGFTTQVAGIGIGGDVWVVPDSNRKIAYWFQTGTWSVANVTVAGWIK